MTTDAHETGRTARLLALMKKGDDAFNARDWATVDTVHHPDMIAYITGLAEPVYGKKAHAAAMQQFLRIFPDMHVYSDPYPVQFGSGDWITVVTRANGKSLRPGVRPDEQVGGRPAHRHLRLLGRHGPAAADRPRLIATGLGVSRRSGWVTGANGIRSTRAPHRGKIPARPGRRPWRDGHSVAGPRRGP